MAFKSIILIFLLAQTVLIKAQTQDPLVTILINKGLITKEDAQTMLSTGDVAQQRDRLAALLRDKGLISATEFEALRGSAQPVATGERVAVNAALPKRRTLLLVLSRQLPRFVFYRSIHRSEKV